MNSYSVVRRSFCNCCGGEGMKLGGEGLGRKLVKVCSGTPTEELPSTWHQLRSRTSTRKGSRLCWCVALLCGVLASSGGLFFEAHDTTTDVALTRRSLSNPALRDVGLKSTSRLLSLFFEGFFVTWDPQKTALICTQYTKEMNASPFPQNLCFETGTRPGLLRFVAEPPGAPVYPSGCKLRLSKILRQPSEASFRDKVGRDKLTNHEVFRLISTAYCLSDNSAGSSAI